MHKMLNRLTLGLVYISLGLGMLFFVSLPWSMPVVLLLPGFQPENTPAYYAALGCWFVAVALGVFIFYTLLRMLLSLSGDPFVQANVTRLKRMGITALMMGGCLSGSAFLYPRPMLFAIAAAACLCGLFSLVLGEVFEKAVAYRQENALTI